MSENFEKSPRIPSPSEKEIRKNVLDDMKEIGRGKAPTPQEDWDLVWVISGPPVDIAEDFTQQKGEGEVLFKHDDVIATRHVAKKRNESRNRLLTGIKIAKEVAATRLNKKVEDLTLEDLKNASPDIYWNSTDWANDNLRQRITEGFLHSYNFPKEKIIISPNLNIEHTGHQFEKIEDSILKDRRNVVVISDIYHLPRVKRYMENENSKVKPENVILYVSEPRDVPIVSAIGEIKKIPKYIALGILPAEKK